MQQTCSFCPTIFPVPFSHCDCDSPEADECSLEKEKVKEHAIIVSGPHRGTHGRWFTRFGSEWTTLCVSVVNYRSNIMTTFTHSPCMQLSLTNWRPVSFLILPFSRFPNAFPQLLFQTLFWRIRKRTEESLSEKLYLRNKESHASSRVTCFKKDYERQNDDAEKAKIHFLLWLPLKCLVFALFCKRSE